jgi:hypothetical protein
MKSDVFPSCRSGLNFSAAAGRDSQRYAAATATVRIPTRRKKNVGDVVQNREFGSGLGRNDAL